MIREVTSSRLQIRLLGEFHLLFDGQPVSGLNADRPQSLLAYLLLHRDTPKSRQHLAFSLWPDSTEGQARTNLRNLLHTLRRSLPEPETFLAADTATVQWQPKASYDLDVARFEAALQQAAHTDDSATIQHCLETAVSLYQGDLLPGNYDDWIIPLRESLRQQYQEALNKLVHLLESTGALRQAVRYAQRLLQLDPFDETAAVQLMRIQAQSGDKAGVRRTYQTLHASLRREIDVAPSEATQDAYAQLMRLETAPLLQPVATTLPEWRPRPLPMPPTHFIGRETELAEIAERLADPNCRLLTILGLGGMGKTRLALQTAVGHQTVFADGVVFVPLVGLQTADLLIPAIADALQFRFAGATELHIQLFSFLSQKEMLLVLDNFEHLLPAAAENGLSGGEIWVTQLRQNAPNVKLLVTSRQRLDLQEEWIYEIGGLPLPEGDDTAVLDDNSALTLFQQSARRIDYHFELSPAEQADAVNICRLVGGMPLGIELAASWVRLLSCAEIAQEIEKGLAFLTGSARNMPERHRSIRAVFDHSWNLLSAEEQMSLARLSVFRGGFTREAAKQVAWAGLPVLSALVNKSLVQRSEARRFDLHELIRQYTADLLKQNAREERSTLERFSEYYLTLLQARDSALRSHQQKEVLAELTQDIDNLRAAWKLAVAGKKMQQIRQAAYTYWYFYNLRDSLREGQLAFRRAADMAQAWLASIEPENGTPDRAQLEGALGHLLGFQAQFAFRRGQIATAESLYRSSLALLRPLEELIALADSLTYLGVVNLIAGKFSEGWLSLNESNSILNQTKDSWRQAQCLTFMGMVSQAQGNYSDAYRFLSDSMSRANTLGDPRLISLVVGQLGRAAYALGRMEEVVEQLQEGLRLASEIGDRLGIGFTLEQLGVAAQLSGDLQGAYELLKKSINQFDEIGDMWFLAHALNLAGFVSLTMGNHSSARSHFRQAGRLAQENQAPPNVLDALVGLAMLDMAENLHERAILTAGLVLEHPASMPDARERAEKLCQEIEVKLSPEQTARLRPSCQSIPLSDLVAEILAGYLVDDR